MCQRRFSDNSRKSSDRRYYFLILWRFFSLLFLFGRWRKFYDAKFPDSGKKKETRCARMAVKHGENNTNSTFFFCKKKPSIYLYRNWLAPNVSSARAQVATICCKREIIKNRKKSIKRGQKNVVVALFFGHKATHVCIYTETTTTQKPLAVSRPEISLFRRGVNESMRFDLSGPASQRKGTSSRLFFCQQPKQDVSTL